MSRKKESSRKQVLKIVEEKVLPKKSPKKGRISKLRRLPGSKGMVEYSGFQGQRTGAFAPAAVMSRLPKLGMSDISKQRISWTAGYILVGNGTVGVADSVYFSPHTSPTGTICVGNIPILGSDGDIGADYYYDIAKHFVTMVIHDQSIKLHSLQPSTSNSMEVLIAPSRGPTGADSMSYSTSAPVQTAYDVVAAMTDCIQASSWEEAGLRLLRYIASGAGSLQNEFPTDMEGNSSGFQGHSNQGMIPTTFVVTGRNTTAALRGTTTHAVIIEQVVTFKDFIGGNVGGDRPFFRKRLERLKTFNKYIDSVLSVAPSTDVKSDVKQPLELRALPLHKTIDLRIDTKSVDEKYMDYVKAAHKSVDSKIDQKSVDEKYTDYVKAAQQQATAVSPTNSLMGDSVVVTAPLKRSNPIDVPASKRKRDA